MTERWSIKDIAAESQDCIHDWEEVVFTEEETREMVIENVKKHIDVLSETDRRSDNFVKCCYDVSLLFALERAEYYETDDDLEDMIQEITQTVYELLSCNYFTKSEIDWDEM